MTSLVRSTQIPGARSADEGELNDVKFRSLRTVATTPVPGVVSTISQLNCRYRNDAILSRFQSREIVTVTISSL